MHSTCTGTGTWRLRTGTCTGTWTTGTGTGTCSLSTWYKTAYLRLSIDSQWTGNSIDIPLNLNLNSQNIYVVYRCADCGSLLALLYTIIWVTSYLWLLALSILTRSSNMSFLALLVSADNSGNSEKNWVGATAFTNYPLRENFARSLSYWSWLPARQIWLS